MRVLSHVVARYRCSDAFPEKVPQLLSDRGFTVSIGRWMSESPKTSREFGFTVSDHVCSVNLSGGVLEDGRPAFLLAAEPTMKLWGYSRRNAFYQRVHEALVSCGAEVWHDYPKTV
jgi:hypothetical protein